MTKKVETKVCLPEDILKHLSAKFDTVEEIDDYIERAIRAEIGIDSIKPQIETEWYRIIRRRVKKLHDAGKELTSETLAQNMLDLNVKVQLARDYLARMKKDGYVKLVRRERSGKKIYHWARKADATTD
jgi:mRNA-degrading endonuclease RelE of RelBE toxin-antitoxin system